MLKINIIALLRFKIGPDRFINSQENFEIDRTKPSCLNKRSELTDRPPIILKNPRF